MSEESQDWFFTTPWEQMQIIIELSMRTWPVVLSTRVVGEGENETTMLSMSWKAVDTELVAQVFADLAKMLPERVAADRAEWESGQTVSVEAQVVPEETE